jgi:hypothetical protein
MPTVGEVEAADGDGSHRSGFFAIPAVLGGGPIAFNCGGHPRRLLPAASCFAAAFIPIPVSAPLPLHCDTRGIADLDPDAARVGAVANHLFQALVLPTIAVES